MPRISLPNLALFRRSLLLDNRRVVPYVFRLILVVMVLVFLHQAEDDYNSAWSRTAVGLSFFESVTYLNLVFITLAGISLFPSAITEEKEDRTLGLLIMAGINPLTMLLSKSGSRLLMGLMLLVAQLPFTLLAVSLGGISMLQIGATYLALCAYLAFICCLALFSSVVCNRSPRACTMTVVGLILFYSLHWLVSLVYGVYSSLFYGDFSEKMWEAEWAQLWNEMSPFTAVSDILSTGFSASPFTFQVISNAVLSVVFFALARAFFTRCSRNADDAADETRWFYFGGKLKALGFFSAGRPQKSGAALTWKDFHFISGGWVGIAIRGVLYGLLVIGCILVQMADDPGGGVSSDVYEFMFWTGIWLFPIEIAVLAGRVFQREVKWQTLSSLATLPMPLSAIAWNKIGGMLPGLIPGAVYLGVGFLCYDESYFHPIEILEEPIGWFLLFGFVFYIHLTAFLSLVVRFGAAALAMAACILLLVLSVMLLSTISMMDDDVFGVLASMVCIVGSAVIHVMVSKRLSLMAAM